MKKLRSSVVSAVDAQQVERILLDEKRAEDVEEKAGDAAEDAEGRTGNDVVRQIEPDRRPVRRRRLVELGLERRHRRAMPLDLVYDLLPVARHVIAADRKRRARCLAAGDAAGRRVGRTRAHAPPGVASQR
jgi:hypothetical protein